MVAYHCGVKTPSPSYKMHFCFLISGASSALDIITCQHISKSIVIIVNKIKILKLSFETIDE